MQHTDIPVTAFARGEAGMMERFAVPAGVAGLAALLLAAEWSAGGARAADAS